MTKTVVLVSALAFGLAVAGLAQAAACGTRGAAGKVSDLKNSEAAKGERLAPGAWGGNHIRMEVSEAGATVEFDCARGRIDRALVLDSEGRFDLKAAYTVERGGPVRRDAPPPTRPARYEGRVSGDTLTLTVTLTDTDEDAGTFTLTRGSEGRVFKCR
ncbi:MAG TPA: hypothetical protein VM936_05965 [Pyrinomonadaceae bacterium]|jgi:hypothetical protein|nr:hypothetical protein [Pyrinomonadaceae bacterium]